MFSYRKLYKNITLEKKIKELSNFFIKNISRKYSIEIIEKYILKALKYNSSRQLKLSLNNLIISPFWRQYSYKHPSWIFDRRRLNILRDLTCNLNEEYFDEIEKIEKLFVQYYNSFILHNYQEYMIYKPFIDKNELFDDIRKVSSFIIINRGNMYNRIKEIVPDEKLVFIFTAILFNIFEEPPCVFQYFKDDKDFWKWFDENWEDCYDLYEYWNVWNWLKEPVELRFTKGEIEEYHEKNKKIKELEKNSVKWNEILLQLKSFEKI